MSPPGEPAAAPPADAVLAVDAAALAARLHALPDADNAVLRLADGRRTASAIVEAAGGDPDGVRAALARLLDAGVLRRVAPGEGAPRAAPHEGADWFASPATPAIAGTPPVSAADRAAARPGEGEGEAPGIVVISPPPGADRARRRAGLWVAAALVAAVALLLGRAVLERLRP
ncbi:MAG TPA: hypothetical protein VFM45_11475 [Anaeromyxobacteraceae bacterium]|nr:hypothetical protein [Anaeromyxobacteraceae bacterium]